MNLKTEIRTADFTDFTDDKRVSLRASDSSCKVQRAENFELETLNFAFLSIRALRVIRGFNFVTAPMGESQKDSGSKPGVAPPGGKRLWENPPTEATTPLGLMPFSPRRPSTTTNENKGSAMKIYLFTFVRFLRAAINRDAVFGPARRAAEACLWRFTRKLLHAPLTAGRPGLRACCSARA